MKARLILGWLLVFVLVAAVGYAQEPAARRLSLAEALRIARENNPDYRSMLNNRWAAGSEARSSALRLVTPTATVTGSHQREQGSEQYYTFLQRNVQTPGNSSVGWGIQFGYSLSGSILADRGLARAELRATDADITGSVTVLETLVRQQYLNLLRAQAQVGMSQRLVERTNQTLEFARARNAVGQGTLIDVRRAEVELGQAEVDLMRARQAVENQVLVLFERLGVPAPTPAAVVPTDSFPVQAPAFSADSLVELALRANPVLLALRARENAAAWGVRSAYSQYAPSLNARVSYGKYRYSTANFGGVDTTTGRVNWRDTTLTSIQPWNLSIGVQLPIFDQFQRTVTTSRARAAQEDARLAIRSRELALRADVTAAYLALVAAYRAIGMQLSNRAAAAEALSLATERYRVGSGTFLELLDAQVASERADAAHVSAVYDYHWAFAALENAVGRTLR